MYKFLMSALIVSYIVIAPFTIFPTLKKIQSKMNKEVEIDYMGILELWNIDTFEGGSKSRTNFLEKQAIKFEKNNLGVFIMVYSMSIEQALLNLSNGQKPDMISFGIGVGNELIQSLNNMDKKYNIRSDLLKGGQNNKTQYAVPYLFGGYVLISDNNYQLNSFLTINNVGYGGASYNNCLIALSENNVVLQDIFNSSNDIDSFTAYDKYLSKHFETLVGTQRDLYRVQNRIEKGTMTSRSFNYLSGFTDLVQYIGISTNDKEKQAICEKYIDFILSKEVQQSIADYNMFSVNQNDIYTNGNLEFKQMEEVLSNELKTLNVFYTKEKLNEIKQLAIKSSQGDKEAKISLSKYLV